MSVLIAAAPLLNIRVFGTPRPKGSLRPFMAANGKARAREQLAGSPDWRQDVITAAFKAVACCNDPECSRLRDGYPYTGPVTVAIALEFTPPKKRQEYPATRPSGDSDKHARNILDALQDAGVIKDDAAVVDLAVSKRYASGAPGARIVVWPGASDFIGDCVNPPSTQEGIPA